MRWIKKSDTLQSSCRVFEVFRTRYHHPDRNIDKDFFTIGSPDWVNVLAITPDHQMVLVRQFRYGINDFSIEIPGGMIEPGEDPLAGGLRELREETGYVGQNARTIGHVHPNPAIQTNLCHLILVENAIPQLAVEWDTDEEIEITTMPIDDVYKMAFAGKITHSLVLDALLFFYPHCAKLRGPQVDKL